MNVLVVFDHPRRSSFCGAVLDSLVAGLAEAGHVAEIADLRSEGFDPRLPPADEPDWSGTKIYSPEVLAEQARLERNDAVAFVFPVWWWSVPATTKGWIDRVWNDGWAYGNARLSLKKARMFALSAGTPDSYAKRGYDSAMQTQLVTGILSYCGIEDAGLELLHGSLEDDATRERILTEARRHGRAF
jgi:NAD(P)H dehydrogenase (quinone)